MGGRRLCTKILSSLGNDSAEDCCCGLPDTTKCVGSRLVGGDHYGHSFGRGYGVGRVKTKKRTTPVWRCRNQAVGVAGVVVRAHEKSPKPCVLWSNRRKKKTTRPVGPVIYIVITAQQIQTKVAQFHTPRIRFGRRRHRKFQHKKMVPGAASACSPLLGHPETRTASKLAATHATKFTSAIAGLPSLELSWVIRRWAGSD